MLTVQNLTSYYSNIKILKDLTFSLQKGKVTCLLGRNGAGKTTTLKSIMGLVDKTEGLISFNDETISGISPHYIPKKGIGYVPQVANVFPSLTIEENLEIGSWSLNKQQKENLKQIYDQFSLLKDRKKDKAGNLSGGQRQILALARALITKPTLLLLDEPSAGLSPVAINEVFSIINDINESGVSILLVEQNAKRALSFSDRGYVLDQGRNAYQGKGEDLLNDPRVIDLYLGKL